MAIDYLEVFRQGKKRQAPPAPAHTHRSDAQTPGPSDEEVHAQELKAEREAIQLEACEVSVRWVDVIHHIPQEVLAASYGELCAIIDREGEEAGEKFIFRLARKFRNRA